jgi:hypothetical protein
MLFCGNKPPFGAFTNIGVSRYGLPSLWTSAGRRSSSLRERCWREEPIR